MALTLVIGNKNYSSWSLRAWLALRKTGVEFEERRFTFGSQEFRDHIGEYSPTRRVPVLHHDGLVVWDSLAICEYANEVLAGGTLWPEDPPLRAEARSISAEMHAGFSVLRERMPMNCRARSRVVPLDESLNAEITRIKALWRDCRRRNAGTGPWLYGRFSIADAMLAPVVMRFMTYGVALEGPELAYSRHVLADPELLEWIRGATAEVEVVEHEEVGF